MDQGSNIINCRDAAPDSAEYFDPNELSITSAQAAAVLGISRQRVYALARAGRLRPARIGSFVVFDRAQVEAFAVSPARKLPPGPKPRR